MRKQIFVSGVAMAMLGLATAHAAQPQSDPTPPVVQTQANPPGPGMPTDTPPNPATAGSPVAPAMPADPSYNAGPYKGALTPPPVEAMAKTYPPCTRVLQDSCVNPGEGVNRAAIATPRHQRSRHVRRP